MPLEVLSWNVVFETVKSPDPPLFIAPPAPPAELPLNDESSTVISPLPLLFIAPPFPVAELLLIFILSSEVSPLDELFINPPSETLSSSPAELPLAVPSFRVNDSDFLLLIAPPSPVDLLFVISTLSNVTVAFSLFATREPSSPAALVIVKFFTSKSVSLTTSKNDLSASPCSFSPETTVSPVPITLNSPFAVSPRSSPIIYGSSSLSVNWKPLLPS